MIAKVLGKDYSSATVSGKKDGQATITATVPAKRRPVRLRSIDRKRTAVDIYSTAWPSRKRIFICLRKGRCNLKLISWNVNGLRACLNKGVYGLFPNSGCGCILYPKTKMQPEQAELILPGYQQVLEFRPKKGYSGTAVFTRMEPVSVRYGIGAEEHEGEGRAITLEFPDFYLVTVYTPNAQRELARIDYRMAWEDAFRAYVKGWTKKSR